MIIDLHNHLGEDIDGEKQNLTELINNMDYSGINYSVVFPFNVNDEKLIFESLNLLQISKENKRITILRISNYLSLFIHPI